MKTSSESLSASKLLEKGTLADNDKNRNLYILLDIQSKTSLFRGTSILVVSTNECHPGRPTTIMVEKQQADTRSNKIR
jgi:hypothetical protein